MINSAASKLWWIRDDIKGSKSKLRSLLICNRRLNSDDLQFNQYQPKYSHRSPQITELNKDHDIWRWHFKYWSGTKWKKWQSYLKSSYIDNWTLQCQYSYHKKKYTDSLPLKKTKMGFFLSLTINWWKQTAMRGEQCDPIGIPTIWRNTFIPKRSKIFSSKILKP